MSYERMQSFMSASSFLLSTSGFASAFEVDTRDESVVANRCSMSEDRVDLILSIL